MFHHTLRTLICLFGPQERNIFRSAWSMGGGMELPGKGQLWASFLVAQGHGLA